MWGGGGGGGGDGGGGGGGGVGGGGGFPLLFLLFLLLSFCASQCGGEVQSQPGVETIGLCYRIDLVCHVLSPRQ